MRRRFVTVDVFTDTQFAGNPLAVVLDAEGLSAVQMQAIAREFNYVESAFVLPPADPANTARVRIFTPMRELPFAGHPNVGTAFALAREGAAFGRPIGGRVAFEEIAGLVAVDLWFDDGRPTGAELTAPAPFQRRPAADAAGLAAALRVGLDDIPTKRHPPLVASVGLPFLIAELRTRAALRRIAADPPAFAALLKRADVTGAHLYTRETSSDDAAGQACDVSARMFCFQPDLIEDPATGSANCALVALVADLLPDPDTTIELAIAQGADLGRPSLLRARASKQAGVVVRVQIGGGCVAMLEGAFSLTGAG